MLLPLTTWTSQQAALHRQALAFLLLPTPQARSRAQGSSSTSSKQHWGRHHIWLLAMVRAAQLMLPGKARQGRSPSLSRCPQPVSMAVPLHLRSQLPPAGMREPADEPPGRLPVPSRPHQQPSVQAKRAPRHLLESPTLVWQRHWLCGCSVLDQGLGLLNKVSRHWARRQIRRTAMQVGSVIGRLLYGVSFMQCMYETLSKCCKGSL